MSLVAQRYAVPAEIDHFVDQGFLEVLTERPDEMTVEFHIPLSGDTKTDPPGRH